MLPSLTQVNARLVRRFFPILFALAFGVPLASFAQEEADGPTSLVITYTAKPETRAAFRAYMEKQGAAQFAQWKKDGVFSNAQILFCAYAGSSAFDLAVILDFRHYTDLARWKEIEKRMPGGLPSEALALGAPDGASFTDVLAHGVAERRDPAKAVYMIASYKVVTDANRYRKYVEAYTVPQMKGWIGAGVLSSYTMYLNQNPAGARWDALLVLEYKDLAGLAQREAVKSKVRAQLAASDAGWKAWSADKGAVRNEIGIAIADAIAPVAAASK